MTDNRRSPYLVLGVPFGASKGEAAKAFARATRRLRRLHDAPYDIEDLNWALHAVEQRAEDPATSIDDYRMPADSRPYDVPPSEAGVLAPSREIVTLESLKASIVRFVAAARANREPEGAPLPALHRFTEEGS